jgi:hypothetical protein
MINPDGVILGNYRSNLQGYDMNKSYATKDCHEVQVFKKYLNTIFISSKPRLFLDIGGHDVQPNITLRALECEEGVEDPSARNMNILLYLCDMFKYVKPDSY